MKPRLIFRGPVLTASGYGVHSRQLLRSLLAMNSFDISVEPINWGKTPFVLDQDPFTKMVIQLAAKRDQEAFQGVKYDISVQCTIPNEFSKMAQVNIGVTAGIEVDRVSPEWILKANNEVDLLIVPSEHSRDVFENSIYDTQDGNQLRLNKPAVVVPEGFDERCFNTSDVSEEASRRFSFDTEWNFLFVGLGMDRALGEDRKNVGNLVKWFCEKFKDDRRVGLVLKSALFNGSLMDFEMMKRRIKEAKQLAECGEFPRVHLVHGHLSDHEMSLLYKHPTVKAFVSLTHGEGFGLPLLEAAACGLPVLAPDWSGHVDFLKVDGKSKFVPLAHDMQPIPASAVWKGVMEEGSCWSSVKEDDVKAKLKKVVLSYDTPKQWAGELAKRLAETHPLARVAHRFAQTLADFLNNKSTPQQQDPVAELKTRYGFEKGKKNLLFTMPMSAGDVYISTGTVAALRKKHPDHKIIFATDPKYFQILEGNDDIDLVVPWEQWMLNVPVLEKIFDEVYTPNIAIQMVGANWVRGGKGRLLADEIAAQCQIEREDPKIMLDYQKIEGLPKQYVAFHPGSGKGQHEARNYLHWQEVVTNIIELSGFPVVQVGTEDEPLFQGCIDYRGKTSYNQLAAVIEQAICLVGIDSVSMHLAAGLGTPHVALFGSSYPTSTGPSRQKSLSVLLETPDRYSCEKACYKYQCEVDRDHPCINEITPQKVVENILTCLPGAKAFLTPENMSKYKEVRPKISGYTHVLNPESQGFPWKESILSMLGFCDEVVVVDGGSTDGSLTWLKDLADNDPKLKMYERAWDWDEPGMDGMQKAFGRAMCSGDFLWQQDADEVVHEEDYEKIRKLVKRFPKDVELLHLPVIELWGDEKFVRTDRHSWKWRLSRNNFRITHGIYKGARVEDEKTGRTYAKKGQSDGCEYIDIMTHEYIPHRGFYNGQFEELRQRDPAAYGEQMNRVFDELPSVFHYSWCDLRRKVRNFRDFWDRCWSNLYNDPAPQPRFPDVKTDQDIERKVLELAAQGGEHQRSPLFTLRRSNPGVMADWIARSRAT